MQLKKDKTLKMMNTLLLPDLITEPPIIAAVVLPIYELKFIALLYSLVSSSVHKSFAATKLAV